MNGADVNTQLSIGHLRQLKERVDISSKRLKILVSENKKNADRLRQMRRRADILESDLQRRLEIERSCLPCVDPAVLRQLDKPLDYELETADQFTEKMANVRQLMMELLVRTNLNEWAAHQEMAEQENEVTSRIRDACNARKMLRDALLDSKKKAEAALAERKDIYEELQRMEHQLEVCSAAAWLAITEQNRLSDRLAILSKEAKVEQCHQTKHCGGRGEHEKQGELYHEIWQSSVSCRLN
ncbi:hypothetical protein Q1695_013674 [Nippostrongylus brasiliensis]|nr:hypothetical protein Q1695_013674 [Nippostrongylus brasiliensis]